MSIVNITTKEEFDNILADGSPVVVDFWAKWCSSCKIFAPVIEILAQEMGDKIKFVNVDTDEMPELQSEHHVMSFPTIQFFKNGIKIGRITGTMSLEELRDLVNRTFKEE